MKKRIAIIGCEPSGQSHFNDGGKKLAGRGIIARRVTAFNGFEPKVHWPITDPKDIPTHKDYDGVIISGSATNLTDEGQPDDSIKTILDFILETHGKIPMLGICFGHQAIASAFGSEVVRFRPRPDEGAELGFVQIKLTGHGRRDKLFEGMGNKPKALFAHLCYVSTIPEDGIILASGLTSPIQSFKVGEATYGVQFHPEYTGDIVRQVMIYYGELLSDVLPPDKSIVLHISDREDHRVLENFLNLL